MKHLDDFFDGYVRHVRTLQGRLNGRESPPDEGQGKAGNYPGRLDKLNPLVTETQNEVVDIEAKTYDILMSQFNMQLIIVSRLF